MGIKEKANEFIARILRGKERPPLERFYVILLAIFIGFAIADLATIYVRQYMLPKDSRPIKPAKPLVQKQFAISEYKSILDRNIFNEDGLIAKPLSSQEDSGDDLLNQTAVKTSLPIELKGTIVHFNPKMSIATVELKTKSITASFRVDEEIEGMALVTKVERKKVTFLNLNNRRLEYAEIPEDDLFKLGLTEPLQSAPGSSGLIEKKGAFDFAIKKSDFDKLKGDMNTILQQAFGQFALSPDGIGVEGFRLMRIQPGSIIEQLGFKPGDMIKNVNGEPVDSMQKALEMFNLFQNSAFVQIGVERDGREEKFNYNVQ